MVSLGHVHIKVSDIKRSEKFYTELFGFKVSERVGNEYIFLTLGKNHHELALKNVGKNAPLPKNNSIGLYHFALEVKNEKQLADIYKKLKEKNIIVELVDHGISKALYLEDPDGNGVEVYIDTRHIRKKCYGKTELLNPEDLLR